jgi:hypothetical protein
VLHEDVFPWVMSKMMDFMKDDDYLGITFDDVVNDAYENQKKKHKAAIHAEK